MRRRGSPIVRRARCPPVPSWVVHGDPAPLVRRYGTADGSTGLRPASSAERRPPAPAGRARARPRPAAAVGAIGFPLSRRSRGDPVRRRPSGHRSTGAHAAGHRAAPPRPAVTPAGQTSPSSGGRRGRPVGRVVRDEATRCRRRPPPRSTSPALPPTGRTPPSPAAPGVEPTGEPARTDPSVTTGAEGSAAGASGPARRPASRPAAPRFSPSRAASSTPESASAGRVRARPFPVRLSTAAWEPGRPRRGHPARAGRADDGETPRPAAAAPGAGPSEPASSTRAPGHPAPPAAGFGADSFEPG